MKNKIQKTNKKDSRLINLESQLNLLLERQEKNSDKLQIIGEELGFFLVRLMKRRASNVKRPTKAAIRQRY